MDYRPDPWRGWWALRSPKVGRLCSRWSCLGGRRATILLVLTLDVRYTRGMRPDPRGAFLAVLCPTLLCAMCSFGVGNRRPGLLPGTERACVLAEGRFATDSNILPQGF
jgi:hypothetical protein